MAALHPGARVLVTGATGFVGSILTKRLSDAGYRVLGVSSTPPRLETRLSDRVDHLTCDLSEQPLPGDALDVDAVVHLAGLAEVGPSFDDPQRYLSENSSMMTHVCEPLLAASSSARILVVSTGAVYSPKSNAAITEDSALGFTSPYAVSKVLVENQATYYRARGLDTVSVRPFNHIGPGQRSGFIVPDLVAKVRALPTGQSLHAGNLNASRDYTDVRDVVSAYVSLLEAEGLAASVYNVASGKSHTGWDVLGAVVHALDVPLPEVTTSATRAIDPSSITGDATRIVDETGWARRYGLQDSVSDYVAAMH